MSDTTREFGTAISKLHRDMKDAADAIRSFLVDAFHLLALFAIGATTVWSAAAIFIRIAAQGHASLGDILLLFIYLEFGAMVRYLLQDHAAAGPIPDVYRDDRPRPRADRDRGR